MLKKICKKPFEWLEISSDPGNNAYLCCPVWLTRDIGSAKHEGILELWRGEKATEIRKSVIDGSFRYCNHQLCPYLVAETDNINVDSPLVNVDGETYRKYLNMVYTQEALPPPKVLNCAYDKSCNLQCPSCRKNIIQSDREERNEKKELIDRVLGDIGNDLELLYITGSGDPFGSRHFWELLTSDLHIRFPQLHYRLHTNALMLDQKRWEKISHLHHRITEIEISIDGASATSYEENRFPGKWNDLLIQMDFIAEMIRNTPSIRLQFNYVVQANNWREMKTFFHLADAWGADLVRFSKLSDWRTFTKEEYNARAVQLPHHPEYVEFLAFLDDPFWTNEKILSDFKSPASTKAVRRAPLPS